MKKVNIVTAKETGNKYFADLINTRFTGFLVALAVRKDLDRQATMELLDLSADILEAAEIEQCAN